MSCLRLRTMRRLPSARKVWKVFTTTLLSKLHKLNRSKAIKKPPKVRLNKTGKKVSWPSFSMKTRPKNQKVHFKSSQKFRCHHHLCLQKRSSPVYIDQLFLEPMTKEHVQASKKEVAPSSPSAKKSELIDKQDNMAGTSNQDGNVNGMMHTADDMWEALVLASPQMHGINERAEEFIASFRADMRLQEMLARR